MDILPPLAVALALCALLTLAYVRLHLAARRIRQTRDAAHPGRIPGLPRTGPPVSDRDRCRALRVRG